MPYMLGEMENALVTARMALQGMVETAANFVFAPIDQTTNAILIRKAIAAQAAIHMVEQISGRSYARASAVCKRVRWGCT